MEIYAYIILGLLVLSILFSEEPKTAFVSTLLYLPLIGRIVGWF